MHSRLSDFSFTRAYASGRNMFLHYLRDVSVMRMIVVLPLMQIILFGYVLNTTPQYLPTAIVDMDHSYNSRVLLRRMAYSQYFAVDPYLDTQTQAQNGLYSGRVQVVITIPPGWGASWELGYANPIAFQVDATDPISSSQASADIAMVLADMQAERVYEPMPYGSDKPFSSATKGLYVQNLYNENLLTKNAITPPLIGIVLTMTLINLTAISIVKERESGTMEMLLTTPIRPLEVMLGKLMPNILVGYIQILIIVLFSVLVLHIPFRGSFLLFLLVSLPFILVNLSFGLLLSTNARSQLEASTAAILVLLPSILLSGFIFPVAGMPWWAQAISAVLPATYYTIITRSLILKGVGFFELWPAIWPLCVISIVIIALAVYNYQETLE